MGLTLACALPPSGQSTARIQVAEELGYERAYLYDSPAVYTDVWMQLALAADATERIGLGPGVLIPLRHPMTDAAAIANLVSIAGPDRVVVGIGSGNSGRLAMGQRPLRWAYVEAYIRALQGLLAGEVTEWDGAFMQMLHPPGFGAARPMDVPLLVGIGGPKGADVARRVGAAGVVMDAIYRVEVEGFQRIALLLQGTILRAGETSSSDRVIDAAGPLAAAIMHRLAEFSMLNSPDRLAWIAPYENSATPRHLEMHRNHIVGFNDYDRPLVTGELLDEFGYLGPPSVWRERIAEYERVGATEIIYMPSGPDVVGELEAFAEMARA
jgi:5,10-methylenetetrahydromethanopterin reductase